MSRRKRKIAVRNIGVDPRFGSLLIQKFINVVMSSGKKNTARYIVYEAMNLLLKKSNGDEKKALDLFHRAFEQVAPHVEVRSRRVGGSVYQIPREVKTRRRQALGLRWIVQAAATRPNKTMGLRLGNELLDAIESRGGAIKKRTDVQRMAEANRAFSHYAW
ncbi:MAG: 30S ribosomal protein S7 [Candidatus Babeliales bacterium]|jgi:small subunit ribosomal protein S7